jgi:hypothetical protein
MGDNLRDQGEARPGQCLQLFDPASTRSIRSTLVMTREAQNSGAVMTSKGRLKGVLDRKSRS